MKKQLLILPFMLFLLTGCSTTDNKNEVENYPTYDTTENMENVNSADPDNSSLNQEPSAGEPN